jgi:hypothetical protein
VTSDFDALDKLLTEANLNRARTRRAFAESRTQESALADERAWAHAARVGDAYLDARYEYEAQRAGLYVDPSTFVDPHAEEGELAGPPPPQTGND